MNRLISGLLAICVTGGMAFADPFEIVVTDTTSGGMTAEQAAGVARATGIWEALLRDPVTVRIDLDFRNITSLGTSASYYDYPNSTYASVRDALGADARSALDAVAVANLTPGPALSFLGHSQYAPIYDPATQTFENETILDANGSVNNTHLWVTRANQKALGLLADDGGIDGAITMGSGWAWDYDPTDGIAAGHYDFVGTLTHEIGHVLGFQSGVDDVEFLQFTHGIDTDGWEMLSVLDLFRYSSESSALAGNVQEFRTGGFDFAGAARTSWQTTPYFSVDRGATNLGLFSSGRGWGDFEQASHWKSQDYLGAPLGLMDPISYAGQRGTITALDRMAFDAIGWDLEPVPEPSTAALMALGLLLGVWYVRRRA